MSFESILKLRRIAAVICLLAGIGMICLSSRLRVSGQYLYLHSFYCGGGIALVASSVVNFLRAHSLLKNPEKRKDAEILELDERNIHIQRVSHSLFAAASLLLTCVAAFIAGLFHPLVCVVLLAVAAGQCVLLLLVTLVVRRIF